MKKIILVVSIVLATMSAQASDSSKEIYNALNVKTQMKPMVELTEYVTFIKKAGGLTCSAEVYHTMTNQDFENGVYNCSLSF